MSPEIREPLSNEPPQSLLHSWARANGALVLPPSERVPVSKEAGAERESLPQDINIAVIDDRILLRECFSKSLETAGFQISTSCFSTVEEWQEVASRHKAVSLILLCRGARRTPTINREIESLSKSGGVVILISDEDDTEAIHEAIRFGARGFIPATMNLQLAVMAMQFVKAGGIYIPESVLRPPEPTKEAEDDGRKQVYGLFTERQAAVVDALRQGKPNKIIAYELTMRESTVKVHIRNIMKKLKAKNRTEVAFITNKLLYGVCE